MRRGPYCLPRSSALSRFRSVWHEPPPGFLEASGFGSSHRLRLILSVEAASCSAGGMPPTAVWNRLLLYQSMYSAVASSTSARLRVVPQPDSGRCSTRSAHSWSRRPMSSARALTRRPRTSFSTMWRKFRDQIMHKTRFVFWAGKDKTEDDDGPAAITVASVLKDIGELLVTFDLITTLPAGTVTYRAQDHARRKDSQGWGAARLGTNRPDNATARSPPAVMLPHLPRQRRPPRPRGPRGRLGRRRASRRC